jgi:hypothetical protein
MATRHNVLDGINPCLTRQGRIQQSHEEATLFDSRIEQIST